MAKSADAFRTISEVAEWLDTPAHVLRFWESKFTQVKPVKRAGGRRYYRPADMELLGGIKRLLHDDGMTIKGVQKLLRDRGVGHVAAMSQPLDDVTAAVRDAIEHRTPPRPQPGNGDGVEDAAVSDITSDIALDVEAEDSPTEPVVVDFGDYSAATPPREAPATGHLPDEEDAAEEPATNLFAEDAEPDTASYADEQDEVASAPPDAPEHAATSAAPEPDAASGDAAAGLLSGGSEADLPPETPVRPPHTSRPAGYAAMGFGASDPARPAPGHVGGGQHVTAPPAAEAAGPVPHHALPQDLGDQGEGLWSSDPLPEPDTATDGTDGTNGTGNIFADAAEAGAPAFPAMDDPTPAAPDSPAPAMAPPDPLWDAAEEAEAAQSLPAAPVAMAEEPEAGAQPMPDPDPAPGDQLQPMASPAPMQRMPDTAVVQRPPVPIPVPLLAQISERTGPLPRDVVPEVRRLAARLQDWVDRQVP